MIDDEPSLGVEQLRSDDPRGRRVERLPVAVLVATLTGFAVWLRAGALNPPSLWLDDLWVITPSRAGSLGDAFDMMVTAPGFSVLANLLPWMVGPDSWAAQLVPFVAGVLAPATTLVVGRRMGWRWPALTVAATVMAVAPEHLIYSARVKQYTLEAAVGLVVVSLAWRLVERRSAAWHLAVVAIGATVLSGSAGVFAGAVVVAACALTVQADRQRIAELILPVGSYGIFAALWWLLYLRPRVPPGLTAFWQPDFITVDEGGRTLLVDLRDSLDRVAEGFIPMAPAWPWLVVAAAILYVTIPRLALLLTAPVVVAVALALLQQAPLGTGRTEIYLLPVAALALGGAVEGISRARTAWAAAGSRALAAGLCTMLVVAVVARDLRSGAYPSEDVRRFIEDAALDVGADTLILVYPASRWAYAVYAGGSFEPKRLDSSPTGFEPVISTPGVHVLRAHRDEPERYIPEIEQAVTGVDRVVFIASHWRGDLQTIETWFPANGWAEVDRDLSDGGRRVEFVMG